MRIVAIIQARTGSTRFPNKVFAELSNRPLIWHVVNRLQFCEKIDQIVLATTINSNDDIIEKWALQNNIDCFRGSEEDVLSRYYYAATKYKANAIVRITADDPFKDPNVIDQTIDMFLQNRLDFAFNNNPPTFPEGLDVEVFSYEALKTAFENSLVAFEREHVTQYFYKNSQFFKTKNLSHVENLSHLRWTIDTRRDFEMALRVYEKLYNANKFFYLEDILDLLKAEPEIARINSEEKRSAMYNKEK